MYNLLIVEDEKEIREGLALMPWHTMGVNLLGYANHGFDALQFVSEHPIDIVLTDIRMPFMDGIELMTLLQRQHPFIRVIILSGHNDFSYAQKALENGAVEYLLKPTNFDSLFKTFEKLVHKLDVEKREELRRSILVRKELLLSKLLREEFLAVLFRSRMPVEEIELGCSESEIILEGLEYTVAMIRLDRISLNGKPSSDRELKLITFSLDNILYDIWDTQGQAYHLINKENAQFYLLSAKPSPKNDFIQVKQQLSRFMGLLKSTLSVSIGKPVKHITEIWSSAQSANQLLDNTTEEDSIHEYIATMKDEGPNTEDNESVPVKITKNKKDSMIVQQAKQFIKQNFHQSITLKQVAHEMYVTPGHLSALFRETGESYLQFLTARRVHKAIELLADVQYKIYEIAELVGYSDQAYFSEIV